MKTRNRYYWVVTYRNHAGEEKTVVIGNEKTKKPKLFPSPTAAARYLEKSGLAGNLAKYNCVLCEVEDE